jgi:hypothetical protein
VEDSGAIIRFIMRGLPNDGQNTPSVQNPGLRDLCAKKSYISLQKRFIATRELAPQAHSAKIHTYFQLCARANYHSRSIRQTPSKRTACLQHLRYIQQRACETSEEIRFYPYARDALLFTHIHKKKTKTVRLAGSSSRGCTVQLRAAAAVHLPAL